LGGSSVGESYKISATVPLRAIALSVAVDERNHRAFVTTTDGIKVYDADERRVIASIDVPDPGSIAVDSTLHRAWVTPENVDETAVYEIDTDTNKHVKSVEIGHNITTVAIDERTHDVYVGSNDQAAEEVSVLNGQTGKLRDSIAVDGTVNTMQVDQWIHRLAVVPGGQDYIQIFDSRTGEAIEKANTTLYTVTSAIDPDTHLAYFAGGDNDSTLITLDLNSGDLTTSTPLANAFGLAVDHARHALFATDDTGKGLQVLDLDTKKQRQEVALGQEARAVTVDRSSHAVFVTAGKSLFVVAR
jgi:DNA-binding beta-propeller fold protein YncE